MRGGEIMIFITGDCHFDFRKLGNQHFPEGKHLTKEDYVIICGDFGVGPWGSNEADAAVSEGDSDSA